MRGLPLLDGDRARGRPVEPLDGGIEEVERFHLAWAIRAVLDKSGENGAMRCSGLFTFQQNWSFVLAYKNYL